MRITMNEAFDKHLFVKNRGDELGNVTIGETMNVELVVDWNKCNLLDTARTVCLDRPPR
jgi:hypothetical protein